MNKLTPDMFSKNALDRLLIDNEKNYRDFTERTHGPIITNFYIKSELARQRAAAEKIRKEKLEKKAQQNRDYRARKKQKEELENANPPEAAV